MTVLFAGGELEAFNQSGAGITEETTSGTFDSACARCAIKVGTALTSYIETPAFTSQTTAWAHFEYHAANSGSNSTSSGATVIQAHNSTGTAVFRIQATASNTLQPQYWNGTTWTSIGTTFTTAANGLYTMDLKIVCGASGSFELYVANSLVSSGSASMTSVDNVAKYRFYCGSTAAAAHVSQVIVADESTVGWKYYLRPPTGNGANTAWTGTYADVDEAVLSTVDYIEGTVANDVETYTGSALTLSGTVKAVVVSSSVKQVASGPQNVQSALRRGSTNYFSSNLSIGAGFAPAIGIFATDPSTGAAWTAANAGSASTEFGLKAIT